MPKPVDYNLSQISAHVITYSDRIQRGTKEDRATPACTAALAEAGLGPVSVAAIPESADILEVVTPLLTAIFHQLDEQR